MRWRLWNKQQILPNTELNLSFSMDTSILNGVGCLEEVTFCFSPTVSYEDLIEVYQALAKAPVIVHIKVGEEVVFTQTLLYRQLQITSITLEDYETSLYIPEEKVWVGQNQPISIIFTSTNPVKLSVPIDIWCKVHLAQTKNIEHLSGIILCSKDTCRAYLRTISIDTLDVCNAGGKLTHPLDGCINRHTPSLENKLILVIQCSKCYAILGTMPANSIQRRVYGGITPLIFLAISEHRKTCQT